MVALLLPSCTGEQEGTGDVWQRDFDAGFKAYQSGNFAAAESFYKKAVKDAAVFGTGDYRLARSQKELGDTYFAQNDYDAARPLYEQSLTIYQRDWQPNMGGEDSRGAALNAAAVLLRLAKIDIARGHADKAEEVLKQAVNIEREQLGSDALLKETTEEYVQLLRAQGRETEARGLIKDVLETESAADVADDSLVNGNWRRVRKSAQSAFYAGNYESSLKLFARALELAQHSNQPENVAVTLQALAKVHAAKHDYAQALKALNRSLSTYRGLKDGTHPQEIAELTADMALIYKEQGRFADSVRAFDAALATYPSKPGSMRLERRWLEELATVYLLDKKYALAQKTIQRKIDIQSGLSAKHNKKLPSDLLILASALAAQNKDAEADAQYEKALDLCAKNESLDQRQLLNLYDSYARFLRQRHRDSEALAIEAKAKSFRADVEKNMVLK